MLFSKKKNRKDAKRAKTQKAVRKERVKRVVKKRIKKARALPKKNLVTKAPKALKGEEARIGKVSHYFPHVKAGAIAIESGTLAIGDTLHIKGHTTNFKQKVKSLQINRVPIKEVSAGDEVGVLVKSRVRINDNVYKVK